MRRGGRWLGVAAVAVSAAAATAQDIQVSASGPVPAESERLLATIAEPLRVQLPAGADPVAAARDLCGTLSPTFLGLLRGANGSRSLVRSSARSELVVPACFVRADPAKAAPAEGETLGAFVERTRGRTGWSALLELVSRNVQLQGMFAGAPEQGGIDIAWVRDRPLEAGQALLLPPVPAIAGYRLRPGQQDAADQVLNLRESLAQTPGGNVAADTGLILESSIDPRLSRAASCNAPLPSDGRPWPFDQAALIGALRRNDELRGERRARVVTIAIADNGVDGLFNLFPRTLFNDNGEADFAGLNLHSRGAPSSLPTRDRWHGTHLARLVLGGPGFVDALGASGAQPRLGLLALSLVRAQTPPYSDEPGYDLPPGSVLDAIRYARSRQVRVINFSVSTPTRMQPVVESLLQPDMPLLVVAAGNQAGSYENGYERYPASFGGSANTVLPFPVLTVAAHGPDGCLAAFSGRGPAAVDLAAPGVAIPSVDRDGSPRSESGTSQATALVSFAAALLFAEGMNNPLAIKARLVASADPRVDLAPHVFARGMLNIIAAVGIHEDRLRLAGEAEPVAARLTAPLTLAQLCPNVSANPGRPIRILAGGEAGTLRVLAQWSGGALGFLDCRPEAAARFRYGRGGGTEAEAALTDILDLLPRN